MCALPTDEAAFVRNRLNRNYLDVMDELRTNKLQRIQQQQQQQPTQQQHQQEYVYILGPQGEILQEMNNLPSAPINQILTDQLETCQKEKTT